MKKSTKFLSLLLAGVLTVGSLAGCGGDKAASDSAASGSDSAKTEESASGEVFKIGGIGPTTGAAAIYGQAVKNAMELAVNEINEAGGINGVQIEMNFQDDEHDAEKSVNAYNTLKDWGMQALLGTVTSTPCIAVATEAANDNMFLLTPSGSAVDCVAAENAFRVCFSDPNQGAASAQYIGENKLASKVAVIYDSSDVYSSGIYEKFATEAANQGFEIVSAEAFTADNNKDFSTQLQKAKDAGAELVFLPIYYTEAALILGQADKMGYDPTFFGCDGMDGILTVENFDTALAEGVMLLTPFAADAYDGMYAIKAAFEKAGVTPDMSASDICEAVKPAMTEINIQGLTGGEDGITWTADGEPNKSPKAVVIKDGAYTAM